MWEEYYAVLRHLPDWLKKPVPFVAESVSFFRESGAESILDLGCGVGRNSIYLGKNGFNVIGVDISRHALKKTKARAKIEDVPSVTVLCCSMTNLPFVRQTFHAIISVSVVHHAVKKDIQRTVNEIRKILKRDGIFLTNLLSTTDCRYGSGEEVEEGSFRFLEKFEVKEFEEVHHFFSKKEILKLLEGFGCISVELIKSGAEKPHEYWKVVAIRAEAKKARA